MIIRAVACCSGQMDPNSLDSSLIISALLHVYYLSGCIIIILASVTGVSYEPDRVHIRIGTNV